LAPWISRLQAIGVLVILGLFQFPFYLRLVAYTVPILVGKMNCCCSKKVNSWVLATEGFDVLALER
jgi:hypothetical protein